ncbi:Uncharacterized protein OS=Isosphaera pallida (strain ATCC 43644 / DSM 9630 / IS1B) GN=Isop_2743 PE=4 SV=1: DUF58 [Gemmataceae bacterium]|nr:Uncharacterized protein OS=Isosphaera pallida (strain ATCC 43644 / DSM 9630 / IS1B) GN=Isop_2743 PE=4 SV=1: DUF58 [Gemmataceae bacterium]VTU01153.1 Uncharacterized protein OS=Isosphaera pallida (strain ATCC 43644 / DSM 9630 / IS1B) GN=Isop_2743 PE=4 SV=1: DUF58 [Gemmataceae bacterium]
MTPAEPLLTPDVLRKLEVLELVSRKVRAGRQRGDRLSKRKGRGAEFADFRPYSAGDDLRFLDWGLFARFERLFLRLFLEDEDLHVHLLLDVSQSMAFGEPQKLLFAKRVAAALGFVGLVNLDRVTVTAFADKVLSKSPAFRGRPALPRLLAALEALEPAGAGDFNRAMRQVAPTLSGRGVVVVLSDFLDRSGFADGLRFLASRGLDTAAVQVLAPEEVEPAVVGDLRLTDAEDGTAAEVTVTADLLDRYRRAVAAHRTRLKGDCNRLGVSLAQATSDVPFDRVALGLLRN